MGPYFIHTSTRLLSDLSRRHYFLSDSSCLSLDGSSHIVLSTVYSKIKVGTQVDATIANEFPVSIYTIDGNSAHSAPCRGLVYKSTFAHFLTDKKKDRAVPTTNIAPKIPIILLIVRKSFKCSNRIFHFDYNLLSSNIVWANCLFTFVKCHPPDS